MFIGVALKSVSLYSRPPDVGNFWGYLASNGKKFAPGVLDNYGEAAVTGDIIGVLLEFGESGASLSFTKNGIALGVAFDSISGELYPAVSLYYEDA